MIQGYITVYGIMITIGAYLISKKLYKRYPFPLTTPVFLSAVMVILILLISHLQFKDYELAKSIMSYPLGAATVALAIPVYKSLDTIKKYLLSTILGLVMGSTVTLVVVILVAKLLHMTEQIIFSLSVKSVTVAIAVEIIKIVGGDISLSAVFVMATGIIGAMFGPWILDKIGICHPLSRGLSVGTIAHGIGTAQIMSEGELQGAISGVAMVIAGIFVSMIAPYIIPWLI